MSDADTDPKRFTIWTAAAARAKAKLKLALGAYVSRSIAESLRKLVK